MHPHATKESTTVTSRRSRVMTATVGTATVITSLANTVGLPMAGATPMATPGTGSSVPQQTSPRGSFAAAVDADPNVVNARKKQIATHRVVEIRHASLLKATAAYKKAKSAKAKKAISAAKAAFAKAVKAAALADTSYLNAEVVAIDKARRSGRPAGSTKPGTGTGTGSSSGSASDSATDSAYSMFLPQPTVWGVPGDQQITLAWAPGSGDNAEKVTGFMISRNGGTLDLVSSADRWISDASLMNGVPYTYSVVALGPDGSRSYPAFVTLTPGDIIATDAPILDGIATDSGALLGISPPTDAATFQVIQDGALIATIPASQTAFPVTGLNNGTSYQFTVTALDAAGNVSPVSNTLSLTPSDMTAPLPALLDGTAGNGQASLTWTGPADAAEWRIYRDGSLITTVPAATTAYSATGLTNGTAYEFLVTGVDAVGNESIPSNAVVLTPAAAADVTPPAAPTALSVGSSANGSVTMSWSGPGDAVAYDIYAATGGGATSLIASTGATSYTVSGLTNGVAYTFTVKARDAAGNTSTASGASITTPQDTIAPGAPTMSATPGDTTGTLSWYGDADTRTWLLYKDGVLLASLPASTTTYSATGLTNGVTYAFTLYARDAANNLSPASATSSITPTAAAPPADTTPPTAPVAALNAGATGNGQAGITWTGAGDTASWLVYKNGTQVATLGAATTSYLATGLTNGTSYSFTVFAKDAAGNTSLTSNTVTATPGDTTPPTAPTSLSGTPGIGTAALTWSGPPDAATYRVYKDGVAVTPVVSSGTSVTITGLSGGTAYAFTVTAIDAAGNESATSSSVSVTPTAAALAAPVLTAGLAYNAWADVTWTAVSGATAYRVYRNGVAVTPDVSSGTSLRVTGLTNGTAASITVKAVTALGVLGTVSNAVSVTPVADLSAPTPPVITRGVRATGTVTLTWTGPADAVAYDVYYKPTGGVATLSGTSATKTYAVTGLTDGAAYTFTVKAKDAAGNASAASVGWVEGPANNVNGTFTGATSVNAKGIAITVTITVVNSTITAVSVPNTWTGKSDSDPINTTNIPKYNAETITAQTAAIANVSGATLTWTSYKTSLQSALTTAGLP